MAIAARIARAWVSAHRPVGAADAPVHGVERAFPCDGCGRVVHPGEYVTLRRNQTRMLCNGCDPFHLAVWRGGGFLGLTGRVVGCDECDAEAAHLTACTRCHGTGAEPTDA